MSVIAGTFAGELGCVSETNMHLMMFSCAVSELLIVHLTWTLLITTLRPTLWFKAVPEAIPFNRLTSPVVSVVIGLFATSTDFNSGDATPSLRYTPENPLVDTVPGTTLPVVVRGAATSLRLLRIGPAFDLARFLFLEYILF